MKSTSNYRKFAFTIAEILIVMGIIGIIAQMTIPTLIRNVQEQETVVSLKKAYSTFSSAYTLAVQENGTPENWDLGGSVSPQGAQNIMDKMSPYLSISKNCGLAAGEGCFANHVQLNVANYGSRWDDSVSKAVLSDGTDFAFFTRSADCTYKQGNTLALSNICADIEIDINGFKPPNILGKDTFRFWITKYEIIPKGTSGDGYSFTNYCYGYDKNNAAIGNGEGCTAWVLYNGNQDYLHCKDLSWTGKHKCD